MNHIKNDFDNSDTLSIDTLALEDNLQEEREKEIAELNRLSKKVCYLHTNLLYYRNNHSKVGTVCNEAWRSLIKSVGSSPNCWMDLGHILGILHNDLDYIKHSVRADPTDTVLKMFMRDENATLDKVIDAFIRMKRYDILKAIEQPLSALAACFNKDDSKSESGYHSSSKELGHKEIICLKNNIPDDLPPALSNKTVLLEKTTNKQNEPIKWPGVTSSEVIREDVPMLFLTYTEDGLETALNIQKLVQNWTEEVLVITLNDRKEEVLQNPEKFVREYYEKADFIVPIITPGYLDAIKSCDPPISNTSDNIDCKYAKYIYKLIVNQYMPGCLNKKVRSVLPQNVDFNIITDISWYPDLTPWTYELSFDETFKVFLKIRS